MGGCVALFHFERQKYYIAAMKVALSIAEYVAKFIIAAIPYTVAYIAATVKQAAIRGFNRANQ